MWTLIQKGGFLIYPLLFCSVLALTVIIERAISLSRVQMNKKNFMKHLAELISRNRIMDAVNYCEKYNTPLSRVIKAGLIKHNQTRDYIQSGVEKAIREEIPFLERYLGILATITAVTPLIGFLGTVSGMIKVFIQVEASAELISPKMLSGGVWEALLTTAFGLAIAIPTLVAYNFFVSRSRNLVNEIEDAGFELLSLLKGEEYEV
ncbi:MAG: MotA/TolQ/ExbB proton channel family protein [Candidatus Ratteibacteria bacterium]|nr:MotA/TolQ/ExbB proton channel family protein [Candidatus Ratteibacteria bacterium]